MSLYKYVERRWMDAFFATGSLRVSTSHTFHDTATFGNARGDDREGRHSVRRVVDEAGISVARGTHEPVISDTFPGLHGSVTNSIFRIEHEAPPCYIFCTSEAFSAELFLRYRSEFSTDACYEIFDEGFFQGISGAILAQGRFVGCWICQYTIDPVDFKSPLAQVSPIILKREEYSWQREVRGIWEAHHFDPMKTLSPVDICVPEARSFCRPIAVIDANEVQLAE